MQYKRVQIVTSAPSEACDAIRHAIAAAGAGQIGEYSFCSFSYTGTGRFMPSNQSAPHIGEPGKLSVITEERIEVVCKKSEAKLVVQALRASHPYEEPVISVIPLIEESDL